MVVLWVVSDVDGTPVLQGGGGAGRQAGDGYNLIQATGRLLWDHVTSLLITLEQNPPRRCHN